MAENYMNVVDALFDVEEGFLPSTPGVYTGLLLRDASRLTGVTDEDDGAYNNGASNAGQGMSAAPGGYTTPAMALRGAAPNAYTTPAMALRGATPSAYTTPEMQLRGGASRALAPSVPLTGRILADGRTMLGQGFGDNLRWLLPMRDHGVAMDARTDSQGEKLVLYRTAERLARSRVDIAFRLKRRGQLFDTRELQKKFDARIAKGGKGSQYDRGAARTPHATSSDLGDWASNGCIWVCMSGDASQPVSFYSAVGKLNRTHHSSLSNGAAVVGAGEWIVKQGRLLRISATSGHYTPTMDAFVQSVRHLETAFQFDTKVWLFNTRKKAWEDRDVREFLKNPSMGGVYRVHPNALDG